MFRSPSLALFPLLDRCMTKMQRSNSFEVSRSIVLWALLEGLESGIAVPGSAGTRQNLVMACSRQVRVPVRVTLGVQSVSHKGVRGTIGDDDDYKVWIIGSVETRAIFDKNIEEDLGLKEHRQAEAEYEDET